MAIQPAQPQAIGAVLDTAFRLYKAVVKRVMSLTVLMAVTSLPPSAYAIMRGLQRQAMLQDPGYWMIYAISMIANIWIIASLYLKVAAIGTGGDIGAAQALRSAGGRLPTLILATILYVIATALGSVLLLIPGLILMVSLVMSFNLVLFEAKGPVEALTGSHRLVWGNWWRILAVLSVGFIILMVLYLLAGLLIGLILPFAQLGGADLLISSMVGGIVVGAAMSLLITPFYASLMLAIYWDLKLRKEGGDLAARVDALSAA